MADVTPSPSHKLADELDAVPRPPDSWNAINASWNATRDENYKLKAVIAGLRDEIVRLRQAGLDNLVDAAAEIEALKHDIERRLAITSEQAKELEALRKPVEEEEVTDAIDHVRKWCEGGGDDVVALLGRQARELSEAEAALDLTNKRRAELFDNLASANALMAECETALAAIAGERPAVDNLMGNSDIARELLKTFRSRMKEAW